MITFNAAGARPLLGCLAEVGQLPRVERGLVHIARAYQGTVQKSPAVQAQQRRRKRQCQSHRRRSKSSLRCRIALPLVRLTSRLPEYAEEAAGEDLPSRSGRRLTPPGIVG